MKKHYIWIGFVVIFFLSYGYLSTPPPCAHGENLFWTLKFTSQSYSKEFSKKVVHENDRIKDSIGLKTNKALCLRSRNRNQQDPEMIARHCYGHCLDLLNSLPQEKRELVEDYVQKMINPGCKELLQIGVYKLTTEKSCISAK